MGAYLELIRQQKQTQQQETELRTNMMSAAETDPDSLARAKKSADMLGLPLQAVQERLPEVEKQAFVEGFGYQDLIKNSPKTAAWLQEDTLNAGVAKDDIENLSLLESVMARVEAGGRSLAAGPLRLNASLWGVPRAGADLVSTLLTGPLANIGVLPEDVGAKASAFFQQKQASAEYATNTVRGDMSRFGPREQALYGGIESAGQTLVALPAAVVTGNPSVLLGTLSASTGGEAYGKARDQGIGTAQALNYAASQAAIEYATEKLPVGTLFRDLGLKRSFARVLTNQLITEMPQEQIATVLQDLNDWATLNPERPFSEYIAARPEAAIQTAIATAVGTGLQTSVASAVDTAVNGPRHKQAEQVFKAVADTAKNSKLRERLPEKFKELAERYAGAQNAFIDATMFNRYFQSVGIDPAAVAAELGVKNYSEAVSAGTDIVIPMGNFAAQLAPTDHLQGLMPDLKLSQGELSAREYEAQQATEGEQGQEIAGQAETETPDVSRQQIFDDVLGQLVGRYERSTAEAYATQYTAGISTLAERMGMDPLELHQRYGLTITSPLPDVLTKRPDLDTVIDPMIDAIRAGNVPENTEAAAAQNELAAWLDQQGIDLNSTDNAAIKKLMYPESEGSQGNKTRVEKKENENGAYYTITTDGVGEYQVSVSTTGVYTKNKSESGKTSHGTLNIEGGVVAANSINRNESSDREDSEIAWIPPTEQHGDVAAQLIADASDIEISNERSAQLTDALKKLVRGEISVSEARAILSEADGREFEQKFTAQGATEIDAGKSQASEMFAGFGGYSYSGSDLLKDGQRVAKLKLRIDGNRLVIDDIEAVRKGQGDGTQAIQAIIAHAHQNGLTPVLITDAMRGKDQQKRLRSYYERLGFIANKGDNKVKGMKEEYYFPAPATATGDVTQTPEFKEWFGDSKVVDADGRPLVVYHGTDAEFDAFDPSLARSASKAEPSDLGVWFSGSSEYSGFHGGNVMELYLSLQNPKIYENGAFQRLIDSGGFAQLREQLEAQGHDGVIVKGKKEKLGRFDVETPANYVAFRPEQIKSAIGNRGTFDPSNPNILFQAAFHGSPYKFDKFTLDHIGSGEGAQAYGWGLYFAGNKEVAEYYRNTLADDANLYIKGKPLKDATLDEWGAVREVARDEGDIEKTIARLASVGKQSQADFLQRMLDKGAKYRAGGQLYEVEIPNDDTLLLWDKPLSEQPEKVRSIFAAIRANTKNMDVQNTLTDFGMAHLSGMDLYNALNKELGSDEAASKYLHSLGINGIKYLDGTSRSQGEGSYNYVIFDDQAIEIVDTYYQRQQDGARGYIRIGDNQRMSIALLERANLSTFLHETGHMYLEVLGDLAASEAAPQQIQDDYKTLLDWFGVESRDQIQVEHHEQFARANEAYLMEGKAPSAALRAVFQRFKAWLTMIYRNISRLDVQLTPEVRAVFDRIYASDEEIEAARAESGMQALFSSAEQMGLTDAEFAAYRNTVTDASVQAQDKLRVELMNEYQREQTKWWNEEREKIRQQVTTEVNAQPVYVAFDALVSGTQGKLSKDDLIRRYGEAYLKRFKRGYGEGRGAVYATDGGGMDIDLAAEIFGYQSGDALVQDLVNIRPRKQLIDAETDARMREQYGDTMLDGTIAERAEYALHNDKRAQVLAAELKALDRQLASERGIRRPFGSADPIRAAAKSLVSQQPVNELQPQRYLLAERKASRLAFEALAVKDRVVAFNEKQRELLNHFLYLEATAAQERADKIAAYAEGLTKRTTQERIGKAGEEYLGALNEILDAYQFRRTTNKQLQLIAKVRAVVAAAAAEGEIIDVMMDEQGNVIDPALLNVRNYRELTIDELEAVRDMLKNIEHVAREKNKFRTAEVQAEFDEIAGKVLDEIADGKPAKPVEVYKLRDPRHQKWRAIPLAIAEWRGLFSYLQESVGFKQNSTLWNYVMRPLNDAAAREAVMKREAAKQLDALFERYSTTYLYGKGKVIPGVGSVNKQQQLMLAASWGTETGRQRMLDNGFDGRGLSEEQVNSVLDSLDERDWGFVKDLWKLFDSYWKPVADKQQRVTGVRPEQVDALPFMTQFGEMPGGYSPIAYESFLDNRAAAQQAAQIADEMKRAAYTRNTTRRGFLKQRVERIQGKAVRYDFGVIYKHLNEVIHDVTHHETLRDVQKLLNHKLDGRSILDEITQRMGYGVRDQIVETLEEIAVGDLRVMGNSERIMEHLAAGASIAGMAYNVWNAVQNITGIANSIAVIGPSAVMRGAWEWIGTPQHMLGSIDTVQEKSEFMRTRYLNMNRDINALRGKLEQASGRPAVDSAYAAYREGGFWMMIRMQQLVDMPTWIGAYDQAKRDFPDITEANAVALADQAVLAAQGGGRTVDLSKFMRGKGWARVWTVFAGYFNVVYQRTAESMLRAGVEGYTPQAVGRMVTDMFFLMIAPAAMTVILKQAIDAMVGGDDDDAEEWMTKYFKEQVSYILAMFPFVRETSAAVAGYASYSGPVGARFFADVNKFIRQVAQGEVDENLVKAGVRVAGTPFGIPTSQIIKTYDGMEEMMAGNATPLALLFGPPKKD